MRQSFSLLDPMVFPSKHPVPTLQGQVVKTESYYFACGGLADLFRGQWNRKQGEHIPVVIKLIRRCTWSDKTAAERSRQRFLRESQLWVRLQHPHIVPFYGLIFERDFPGLVMPYYKNGDLMNFLRKSPQINRLDLICEVAAGLEYLHSLKPHAVVHGDVKASNILVTDNHHACLTDFGMAKMLSVSGFTTSATGGTCRWMAPELLEEFELRPTTASDIWAFGMTILQIYTGKLPFEELRNDATVVISLSRGALPTRPPQIDDSIWALLKRCWASQPSQRPSISTLFIVLNIMSHERLTSTEVDELIDYLESQLPLPNNSEEHPSSPGAPSHPATPTENPGKKSLLSSLRSLSLDQITSDMSHIAEKRSITKSLRRRSADPKLPSLQGAGGHAFHCSWPGCYGHFTALNSLQAHDTRHWHSWKASNEDLDAGTRVMPGIASVLE